MLKSPEIEPIQHEANIKAEEARRTKGESGYSEKEQARDVEARSGDLSSQKRSRGVHWHESAKMLEEYKTMSRQLDDLVESYVSLLEKDLHQAKKMLEDIEKIRSAQKELLDRIFGK